MRQTELLPPAIFAQSQSQQINYVLKAAKDFSSEEEYIHYLTHEVNNIVHKDGRIYMKIDETGLLYANSVSPYSKDFLKNIEPRIKPLVDILISKRYLTYSSCEGHGPTFRRYVGLAFADEASRQYVVDYVSKLNIRGVTLKLMDSVCNQNIDAKGKRNIEYVGKYDPSTVEQKEAEVKTFNIQFHRNYSEYFFLEICILEEISFNLELIKHPFKSVWLYWMKRYRWDKLTKQLTEGLSSGEFKKYKF